MDLDEALSILLSEWEPEPVLDGESDVPERPEDMWLPKMGLNDVARLSAEIAKSKGWDDSEVKFPEVCALIHSEVSEALEAYRDKPNDDYWDEDGKPEGSAVELVDAVIRIAHYFGRRGLDLEKIVRWKLAYNRRRSYRHGGKAC